MDDNSNCSQLERTQRNPSRQESRIQTIPGKDVGIMSSGLSLIGLEA